LAGSPEDESANTVVMLVAETESTDPSASPTFEFTLIRLATALLPKNQILEGLPMDTDFRTFTREQWEYELRRLPTARARLCFALKRFPDALVTRFMFRHEWRAMTAESMDRVFRTPEAGASLVPPHVV
jgi:hypothetical protein